MLIDARGRMRRLNCCLSPLKLGHYLIIQKQFVMARKRHSEEDILGLCVRSN